MVEIRDLWLSYPGAAQAAVQGISLSVDKGEFLTLLGPSGCGKTTTLRSLAGLETPSAGTIAIAGQPVFDASKHVAVPAHARDIAMVFQSYAIWPHMSVRQNVAFPLEVMKLSREETRKRVDEALDMVGLREFAERSATRLSGGQQQRVAIARALVRRAAVMLLDEPLSNLDAKLREQMRIELRELLKRVGMTAVYVTHDQEEALMLSDRIALMNAGRIVEIGPPRGLYLSPSTAFGAAFLGAAEVIPVIATRGRIVQTPLGELELEQEHQDLASITIRPESIAVRTAADASVPAPNRRAARVLGVVFSGRQQQLRLELEAGHRLTALVDPHRAYTAGDAVQVEFPPARLMPLRKEAP
jgi:ABC-type Fe3+/spermidine/putrescine transport system ATPase subunit